MEGYKRGRGPKVLNRRDFSLATSPRGSIAQQVSLVHAVGLLHGELTWKEYFG
jgi:hypothetical protein